MLCKLTEKEQLSAGVYDYTVHCPEMAVKTKAGQFLHILCGGEAYLRRPISVCEVIDGEYLRFIFGVRGVGTEELAKAECGSMIDILGPLGNGFDLDLGREGRVLLIGGGIGIFPLLELAKYFGKRASVILGFKNAGDVMLTEEFGRYAANVFVATDDGSCGFKGTAVDLLKNIIHSNAVAAAYICGPTPMMRAAAGVTAENKIPAQVSLEERMGCGIGACVTCACTVRGQKKRVCKDGPVFMASEVEWNG